jgi:hypothetical protein
MVSWIEMDQCSIRCPNAVEFIKKYVTYLLVMSGAQGCGIGDEAGVLIWNRFAKAYEIFRH